MTDTAGYSSGSVILLDRIRAAFLDRHYSYKTEKAYIRWITKYVFFHGLRDPVELGEKEISAFINHLAVDENHSPSTQNQALCALIFLYRHVLERKVTGIGRFFRADRPGRLPVVFSRGEVRAVLAQLEGVHWIMAVLLYGAGLRLRECLQLRVRDVDFDGGRIAVRDVWSGKGRVVPLPRAVREPLKAHLERVRRIHERDLREGFGSVYLPDTVKRKHPDSPREWEWQYVFPARWISTDPRSGVQRRHHVYETVLQKAVKKAVRRAGIGRPAGCHSLRHSFAAHLLEDGCDVLIVQALLGTGDGKTALFLGLGSGQSCSRVWNKGLPKVTSPADGL